MFRADHIDHVEVYVADVASAEEWYGQVFGLKRMVSWDPEPVMIGNGNNKLALFQASMRGMRKRKTHMAPERMRRTGIASPGTRMRQALFERRSICGR